MRPGAGVKRTRITGAQLQRLLDKLEMSQSEAARQLGVEQVTMYRWIHGKSPIPIAVAIAVKCWLSHGSRSDG